MEESGEQGSEQQAPVTYPTKEFFGGDGKHSPTHSRARRASKISRAVAALQKPGEEASTTTLQPDKGPEGAGEAVTPQQLTNTTGNPEIQESPAPVEPAPEEAKKPKLSPQLQALARAEKRLREERKAFEAERTKSAAELREVQELHALAAKDKYAVLDKLGIDIGEWARRKLAEGDEKPAGKDLPELAALREENKATRDELEKYKKEREDIEQRQNYDHQKKLALDAIAQMADSSPDKYAHVREQNLYEQVWDVIESYFTLTQQEYGTGQVLDFSTALEEVENRERERIDKLLELEVVKRRLGSKPKPPVQDSGAERVQPAPQSTNAPDRVVQSGLSRGERRARALARLKAGQP